MNPLLKFLIVIGFFAICAVLLAYVAISTPSAGEREEDEE